LWWLADQYFVAVVDVDAGQGGQVLAHGLAHQVVVVVGAAVASAVL
jgi:hypothetical protein